MKKGILKNKEEVEDNHDEENKMGELKNERKTGRESKIKERKNLNSM